MGDDKYLPPDFVVKALDDLILKGRVSAMLAAYDAAVKDEKTVIPTPLMLAIEVLR